MSASPAMSDAAALAGSWTLSGPRGICAIELGLEDQPLDQGSLAAPMLAVRVGEGCPGSEAVVGWRPVPLGLTLANSAGFSALTFERTGADAYTSIDQAWTLNRP